MRNIILIIEDNFEFAKILRKRIKGALGSSYEFLIIPSQEEALPLIRSIKDDDFIFAFVDNNLRNKDDGIEIGKFLNNKKIQFVLASSDCTGKLLDAQKKLPYCRNVFSKNDFSLLVFQLTKDIENSRRNFLQVNKLKSLEDVSLSKGILMGRSFITKELATKKMQKLSQLKRISLKEYCSTLLEEHEFLASN